MYAIRSYYEVIKTADEQDKNKEINYVSPEGFVITSYSIHYTKLYEVTMRPIFNLVMK